MWVKCRGPISPINKEIQNILGITFKHSKNIFEQFIKHFITLCMAILSVKCRGPISPGGSLKHILTKTFNYSKNSLNNSLSTYVTQAALDIEIWVKCKGTISPGGSIKHILTTTFKHSKNCLNN
ncbi:hypothetical protein NQD34_012311 [Periophthalmus magnuspinnatus]|nr:hypothetical protein NQD34_012311 [Periophthalmus magnuspinnatus]